MAQGPTTELQQAARVPGTIQATLVLESPHDKIFGGDWVIRELPRWLRPEKTRLHFVRAVSALDDSNWFNKQPEQYLEAVTEQQREVAEANRLVLEQLQSQKFELIREYTDVISDRTAKRILRDIQNTHEDLLILASTESPQAEHVASSFSYRMTSHAPCSVLMLKRPLRHWEQPLKVILATDGTEASANAARKLPDLLHTEQMEVTIVTVQNPDVLENAIFAPYVNTSAVDEALRENAAMILNIARDLLESRGIKVRETQRILGSPAWELLHHMREAEPDLVVVGSHNRTGLPAWLLGSISSRLVQQDTHSILVVR